MVYSTFSGKFPFWSLDWGIYDAAREGQKGKQNRQVVFENIYHHFSVIRTILFVRNNRLTNSYSSLLWRPLLFIVIVSGIG